MKKLLALLIIVSMALCLFSCGSNETVVDDDHEHEDEEIRETEDDANENEDEDEETTEEDVNNEYDPDSDNDFEVSIPEVPQEDDDADNEEEIVVKGPQFESDYLSIYADWTGTKIEKIHKDKVGRLYIETEDGFYHFGDTDMSDNYLDNEDIAEWGYNAFAYDGFYYVDANGYMHFDDFLAYDIKGEIIYAFDSMGGDFVVYSYDETDGHVYKSTFEDTGKKVDDNVMLTFEEKEQDGYSFTHLGKYETVEYLRVLPSKGNYVSGPDILLTVNGNTYVTNFNIIVADNVSLITNDMLSADATKNFLDYVYYEVAYSKDDVADQLFYTHEGDEFVIYLPDGHTVDEITYFNRGNTDMLIFDNGDVYTWDGQASILGENPEKNEALTEISADIIEIIYCNTEYRVLMSDGCIYTIGEYYY